VLFEFDFPIIFEAISMNEANQEPKIDIWASMRENRLRRERRNKYLVPIANLASLFVVPGMAWFMVNELPCSQNQQIAHIGWQNHQIVQFQPVKIETSDELLACTLHNSSAIYNTGGDAFDYVQAHSVKIIVWGTLFILFGAGVQLYFWLIKSLFSR
jgi:hypothetical protein